MAYFESAHIWGAYGSGTEPPAQWCSIEIAINQNTQKIDYTLKIYSEYSSVRYILHNISASIGGINVYYNSYIDYNSYSTPWTVKTGSIDMSSVTINNGYIPCSFSIGVGANWNTTTASGSIPAIIPTVNTPTYSIVSGGYGTTIVGGRSTIKITMSGSTSGGTITQYRLLENNTQLYSGSGNTYSFIPSSGSHTYKAQVRNSYGVWSNTSSNLSITAQTYTPPVITKTVSQRWSSNNPSTGHAQDNGKHGKLSLSFTPGKIGTTPLTTYWKVTVGSYASPNQTSSGAAVCTPGAILGDGTYQVKYSVWDAYISSPTIDRNDVISMAGRGAIDFYYNNGVHGIGFGTAGEAGKANFKFTPYFECNNQMVSLVDIVYPIGSIYMSVNNVNPSSLFPNTKWERIKDTFLYCGSDTAPASGAIDYRPGNSGGDKNSVAKHNHKLRQGYGMNSYDSPDDVGRNGLRHTNYLEGIEWSGAYDQSTGVTDGNMPPWLAVYVWKRVQQ